MLTRRLDARAALGLLAVAVIWMTAMLAAQRTHAPAVAVGAAFDVSITAGLALYLIAVRGGHLPRWALPVTVTVGLAMARLVFGRMPGIGSAVMMTAALIEVAMLAMTIIGARRAVRAWRATRLAGAAVLDRFEAAFVAVGFPGRVARIVATEVTLIGYALLGWRTPRTVRFTVHRTGGWALYAGVLAFLTLVETSVVHILLAAYVSVTAAWIASALSLYGVLWLVGDVQALRHGGVTVGRDALELELGVRWSGRIPWTSIASIERGAAPDEPGVVDASILGANVILRLRTPCTLVGLLGRRRTGTIVALSIDQPTTLLQTIATLRGDVAVSC